MRLTGLSDDPAVGGIIRGSLVFWPAEFLFSYMNNYTLPRVCQSGRPQTSVRAKVKA
jgi:hypothetical protein